MHNQQLSASLELAQDCMRHKLKAESIKWGAMKYRNLR